MSDSKLAWQSLEPFLYRAAVQNGWIVQQYREVFDKSYTSELVSTFFIPDEHHIWLNDKQPTAQPTETCKYKRHPTAYKVIVNPHNDCMCDESRQDCQTCGKRIEVVE